MKRFIFYLLLDYNLFCMKYIFPLYLMFLTIACNPPLATEYNSFPLLEIDIEHLQEGYTQGDFTIAEVTQAYLDRIDKIDKKGPELNSFITINPDAIRIAQSLDKERSNGNFRGPLHGIPIVLKR